MTDNYTKIALDNLDRLYHDLPKDLAINLPGSQDGECFAFKAFGETCLIEPGNIQLGDGKCASVFCILISLYALNACPDVCVPDPLKAFKEFPDSMPYVGAFATHTETILAPHVDRIKQSIPLIIKVLDGEETTRETGGDFSFRVYPLPKIALCYIFYEADEEFPASVTCLYSNNAHRFLPIDGLADVGEYCSKKILELIAPC